MQSNYRVLKLSLGLLMVCGLFGCGKNDSVASNAGTTSTTDSAAGGTGTKVEMPANTKGGAGASMGVPTRSERPTKAPD